jgi:hypothetical protein
MLLCQVWRMDLMTVFFQAKAAKKLRKVRKTETLFP